MDTDTYICLDCKNTFNHYVSTEGIVRCPYCGGERIKVKEKITIHAKHNGELEINKSVEIRLAHKYMELIVQIIFVLIGLYVAVFILPGALTAIATTALTSVNGGVQTLFQVFVPIMSVVVLILLLMGVVRRGIL